MPASVQILKITAALLPPLAVFGPRGAAVVLGLAGLAVLITERRTIWARLAGLGLSPIGILMLAIVFWSAISLAWAPDVSRGVKTILSFLTLSLFGFALTIAARSLTTDQKQAIGQTLFWGFIAALLLLGTEILTNGFINSALRNATGSTPFELNTFNQGVAVLGLLLWPALAGATKHRLWSWAGIGLAAIIFLKLDSLAAMVGLAGGVAIYAITLFAPTFMTALAKTVVIVGILLSPALPKAVPVGADLVDVWPSVSSSILHRSYIWEFSANRTWDKPWGGWGIASSRHIQKISGTTTRADRPIEGDGTQQIWLRHYQRALLPLHPHNGALQIWLELGVIGAALLAAFMLILFRRIETLTQAEDRAMVLGLMFAGLMMWLTAFGIWQSWWIATLWLTVAFTTIRVSTSAESHS